MTDKAFTSAHPTHPEGGSKDTNDLSDVKKVPAPGMEDKARQVEQTPQRVTGELDGSQPINRRP
ncbi:hypothetical protein HNQ07_000076 [Deinococcus metalli]|uniref:Uncharacterized protein n=1 Tax=Deinococcus metalli TaxID=1141878 RepID=A0A7W8NPZ9_9DEIO|nr:hypothetical protein [Deinococcus metalli]MBB5374632.1 hypothetical protein [Deinococcus metalli]GHF34866.1 hypothetical protein GCM10017781_09650 [Deinococcus metalli]